MRCPSALWILLAIVAADASTEDAARRILSARCWACHTETAMGSLRLDSRAAMLRGGNSGPAIVPGSASRSRMYQALTRTKPGVTPMPPGSPLPAQEVETIQAWLDAGAPWSEAAVHWSFQPLRPVREGDSIDRIVAGSLHAKRLAANPRADKRTLIRRAYFDLIGLPPDEQEFARAFNDPDPAWFTRLVSRLLGSPHFGEKWGRHWLDAARYGEDDFSGTAVIPYANAWRYRDWVVQALNQDMPYVRFLMAQLAGDLMNDSALLPATGLLGLGPWYYGIAQPPQSRADERHDRVDMVTRGMLGVTVACARCHDHKYDPFTMQDYYALAGVFASTAYREYPLVPEAQVKSWKEHKEALDAAERALHKFLDKQAENLAARFATQISAYMMATVDDTGGLQRDVVERWNQYLAKPEEHHPFLRAWFEGEKNREQAKAFEALILQIKDEKKAVDEDNHRLVEAAKKNAPKIVRTIVLPGGYRSEEDFNPGAYIPSKSLERDRFVAWNRIFGEKDSPLKFDRELTARLLDPAARPEYERLKTAAETLKKALPPQYPYLHGAGEFEPWDLRLNLRGNPESLGEVVPRRFPTALSTGKFIPFDQGSGRLQLAETIARHPLAARVAVNRIWLALFGQGLVRTPSNLGRVGDRPALPDLLEHLAARFVEHRYSVKDMIREIVLSDAYQRSSSNNAANQKIDAENRYLWRQNRRRLEAEPLLDAMLAVSGELERAIGGQSRPLDADFRRRTLYAKTGRFQQDETLSLFDLPVASVTCEQRAVTNVPLQKLFFLNSDTAVRRAAALAQRLPGKAEDAAITAAYSLLFQRQPSERERRLGRAFLQTARAERWREYAQVLLSSNEFAYVD
jgi:cytochrome c553